MSIVAFRLKELRKKYGYTQEYVGNELHVSKSVISRYENNGRKPSYEMLEKFSKFYGVPLYYLLGEEVTVDLIKESSDHISKEDVLILSEIKKDEGLYSLFLKDPKKAVKIISKKI